VQAASATRDEVLEDETATLEDEMAALDAFDDDTAALDDLGDEAGALDDLEDETATLDVLEDEAATLDVLDGVVVAVVVRACLRTNCPIRSAPHR